MPGPDPENKRRVNPFGNPGDPERGSLMPDKSLGAKDPFEGSEHAPATRNLEPNDVRQRPYPESSTDSFPEHSADLGWDK